MEIRATEQDGISILALSGRMDAGTTPEFDRATQALLGQGKNVVLIDMEELESMAAEVFRISGFNAMLAVRATREEAIGVLRS